MQASTLVSLTPDVQILLEKNYRLTTFDAQCKVSKQEMRYGHLAF